MADLIALRIEKAKRASASPQDEDTPMGTANSTPAPAAEAAVETTPRAVRTVVNSRTSLSFDEPTPRAPSPTQSVISFHSSVNTFDDPFEGVLPEPAVSGSNRLPSLGVWTRSCLSVAGGPLDGVTYEVIERAWVKSGGSWKSLAHFLRVRAYPRAAIDFLGAMVRLDVEEAPYVSLTK